MRHIARLNTRAASYDYSTCLALGFMPVSLPFHAIKTKYLKGSEFEGKREPSSSPHEEFFIISGKFHLESNINK